MSRRRVTVELELEVARANRSAAEIAATLRGTKAELAGFGDEADDASRDLEQLAVNADVAKRQVDDLGDEALVAGRDLDFAKRQVDGLGDEARAAALDLALLNAALLATSANARGLDLGGGLDLDGVARAGAQVGGSTARGAGAAGASGLDGFGRMSLRNPYAIAGILTAISAAGPAIGAMIAGIIAGAIGTGGVAGGLIMASRSPQVRAAAKDFGDSISAEFFRGGDAFVGPAIESLDILEQAFMDMKVPEAFSKMAPEVRIIAGGLGDLGRNIMPGVNAAFGRMGPYADAAADGFGDLGSALGSFVDDVTASPGAVLGLRTAFMLMNGTIIFVGKNIQFLADAFGGLISMGAKFGQNDIIKFLSLGMSDKPSAAMRAWIDALDDVRPAAADAAYGVGTFGEAASLAAQAAGGLRYALSDLHSEFLDWAGAQISAEEALDQLQTSLERYGLTLDVNTAAGRENLRQLRDFATDARAAAEAKFVETRSVEQAQAVYADYRQRLEDLLLAEGYVAAEAQRLTDLWLGFANAPDIAKNITLTVTTFGEYQDVLAAEHASRRAAGGPVLAGRLYSYGEQQPELFRPAVGGWVMPLTSQPITAAGGPAGGGIDYDRLAAAMSKVQLAGVAVMDGYEVGQLTSAHATDDAYRRPRL